MVTLQNWVPTPTVHPCSFTVSCPFYHASLCLSGASFMMKSPKSADLTELSSLSSEGQIFDGQVKVRGNRVELSSIDSLVCQEIGNKHDITGAATTLQSNKLITFVVRRGVLLPSRRPSQACGPRPEWRRIPAGKLPTYSVPDDSFLGKVAHRH